jgi:hypothetical protein
MEYRTAVFETLAPFLAGRIFWTIGGVLKQPRLDPQDALGEADVLNDPLVCTLSQQVIKSYAAGREKLPEHQNNIAVERIPFPPGSGVGKSVDQSWLVHDLGTIAVPATPSSDVLPNFSSPGCDPRPTFPGI